MTRVLNDSTGHCKGFKLYGKQYKCEHVFGTLSPDEQIAAAHNLKRIAPSLRLRDWEYLAIDAMTHQYTGTAVVPEDTPFSQRVGRRALIVSTPRGSVAIFHNDCGLHNVVLNHPNDMFIINALAKKLPITWCVADEHTTRIWTKLGLKKWSTDSGEVLFRKNYNSAYHCGRVVSLQVWNMFRKSALELQCTVWKLSN